jgi:hypothetical protein
LAKRISTWAPAVIALLGVGCAEQPSDPGGELPVDPGQVPPVPVDLAVEVSAGEVLLSWRVVDATGVTDYRVYRATTGAFQLVAAPTQTAFRDGQVVAGTTYRYQVAARRGGLEGERSAVVAGTPGLFSIVLENGAEITGGNGVEPGSRKVRVGLVAPSVTVAYRLSEDSTFAGSPQQGFDPLAPTTVFALSPGDGEKTVFARFEDGGGTMSELVRGTIRLDTRAVIASVAEDSNGAELHVNDILHLAMVVDTTGGTAAVSLGTVYTGLRLFDDGSNGDPTAFDASYERDFTIPAGLEVVNAVVLGSFTDEVGNAADALGAATRITIAEPPDPVLFDVPGSQVVGAGIALSWSRSDDADFARYRIFRSPPGGGPVDESDALVASIVARDSTGLTDRNLTGGATYTWGVQAVDQNGFRSTLHAMTRTLAFDPAVVSPGVSPGSGTPSTVFQYTCTYRHAGNVAPSYVRVLVDANQVFVMAKVGSGTNWVAGEPFRVDASLAVGGHNFFFEAVALDGSSTRNPATPGLVFGGPSVSP